MLDLNEIEAEIAHLVNQMQDQPEDKHEIHAQLREKLMKMRAYGMPVPDDLRRLEKELDAEFAKEKAGS